MIVTVINESVYIFADVADNDVNRAMEHMRLSSQNQNSNQQPEKWVKSESKETERGNCWSVTVNQ